jgi:hypothetical protein
VGEERLDKAREILAPVHGRFTEGFDTIDLGAAQALLGDLQINLHKTAKLLNPWSERSVGTGTNSVKWH